MKILVTGADGKIGRRFVEQGAYHLNGDVRQFGEIFESIKNRVNYVLKEPFVVLHMAAVTSVEFCEKNTNVAFETNVIGTGNVLEATRITGGRVVLFSTCHVFNGNRYWPYSEKHTPDPVNHYGFTKLAAEGMCVQYRDSLVLRLGKVYDDQDKEKIKAETEEVPSFFVRNFIHVDDLMKKIQALLKVPLRDFPYYKKWYRVLHVGTEMNWSQHRFYNMVRSEAGLSELPPRHSEIGGMAPRPYRAGLDTGAMRKLLK